MKKVKKEEKPAKKRKSEESDDEKPLVIFEWINIYDNANFYENVNLSELFPGYIPVVEAQNNLFRMNCLKQSFVIDSSF